MTTLTPAQRRAWNRLRTAERNASKAEQRFGMAQVELTEADATWTLAVRQLIQAQQLWGKARPK